MLAARFQRPRRAFVLRSHDERPNMDDRETFVVFANLTARNQALCEQKLNRNVLKFGER